MERVERHTLLCQIVADFLVPGEKEPLSFVSEGAEALRSAAVLAELRGELVEGLFELVDLTYYLEGKGDSAAAAFQIRAAIAGVPEAMAALSIDRASGARGLKELAKKRARDKNRAQKARAVAGGN